MAKFKLMHDGEQYIEICDGGYSAEILEYGATLKSLFVPDRNGVFENIVCGFDTLADYKKSGGASARLWEDAATEYQIPASPLTERSMFFPKTTV